MASGKSLAFKNLMLSHYFGSTTYAPPGSIYMGLWTATLSAASTGATGGEVSGGGYARAAIRNDTGNFPAAAGGTVSNGSAINFGTASGSWGTVTDFALLNAPSAGTILYWGLLGTSKIIQTNDPVTVSVGDLDITEA